MAKASSSGNKEIKVVEKKTYQGNSKRTRFSAKSSGPAKKKYRGQGK